MSTTPCASCPWRRDSDPHEIPNFELDKARKLVCTVGDGSDDFRPIMACHGSTEVCNRPCVGYVAKVGYTNLSVRIAALDNTIPLGEIAADTADLDLYDTFDEMLDNIEARW